MRDRYVPTVYGIGYLGVGLYKTKINNKETKSYTAWKAMMYRCYDEEFHKKKPSYIGCSVCVSWHNYQIFADWYNTFYIDGYHLDKDLLIRGNKTYSEQTCCFLPQDINKLFLECNKSRGLLPIGVSKYKEQFKATISINNKQIHLGYFSNAQLAFDIYKIAKENHIKDIANAKKNEITIQVYQAMMNYTIN